MAELWFEFAWVGVGRFDTFDFGVTVAVVSPGVDNKLSLPVIMVAFLTALVLLLTDLFGGMVGF